MAVARPQPSRFRNVADPTGTTACVRAGWWGDGTLAQIVRRHADQHSDSSPTWVSAEGMVYFMIRRLWFSS